MSRSFRYNQDEESDVLFDDSELTSDSTITTSSDAHGDLQIERKLSSRNKKKANRELRIQRRHDERNV